jgi:hypothetical protein
MQVVPFPSRQPRTTHRYELRSLTPVTMEGNTGIVRNLSSRGLGVQAISSLRPQQRVNLHFSLRSPRLKVDAPGEVIWTDSSNFCGIAFLDLPSRLSHQIDEWIFSNLVDIARGQDDDGSLFFGSSAHTFPQAQDQTDIDGLTLSSTSREPIRLGADLSIPSQNLNARAFDLASDDAAAGAQLNWLSRPLSPKALAWAVDGLLIFAALLLFIFIFLSIAHELPPWPQTLGFVVTIGVLILLVYRGLFGSLGGTLGDRLTRMDGDQEKNDQSMRFR